MTKNKKEVKRKLQEFGKTIGLDDKEIYHSKRVMKTVVCVAIVACAFTVISLLSSRLGAVGSWYNGASIHDFYLFRGLF